MGVRDHVGWRFSGLGLYVSVAILLRRRGFHQQCILGVTGLPARRLSCYG